MGKTKRDTSAAVEEAFHKHYRSIWSEDRWNNSLYPALSRPTRYAALINRYAPESETYRKFEDVGIELEDLEDLKLPSVASNTPELDSKDRSIIAKVRSSKDSNGNDTEASFDSIFPPPFLTESGSPDRCKVTHWNLDAASVLVAHLLAVKPGENVLDLCAAPGGKSIALAQMMFPQWYSDRPLLDPESCTKLIGNLHSNEYDPNRQRDLETNLRQYLPQTLMTANNVQLFNVNGSKPLTYRKFPCTRGYDKVLVDAPCSSERHIIQAHLKAKGVGRSAAEMANWRQGSTKRLQETQVALLVTALRAVKVGGTVMYATCSIESGENDGVIEKLRTVLDKDRKKGGISWSFEVGFNSGNGNEELEAGLKKDWAEKTEHGWIVLPDHDAGGRWGPFFFALLTKVNATG